MNLGQEEYRHPIRKLKTYEKMLERLIFALDWSGRLIPAEDCWGNASVLLCSDTCLQTDPDGKSLVIVEHILIESFQKQAGYALVYWNGRTIFLTDGPAMCDFTVPAEVEALKLYLMGVIKGIEAIEGGAA